MVEETKGEGIKLADAIAEYKAEIKEHKAKRTYVAYASALDLFVKGCNKTYVDEISRGCIMSFAAQNCQATSPNLAGWLEYTALTRAPKPARQSRARTPAKNNLASRLQRRTNSGSSPSASSGPGTWL